MTDPKIPDKLFFRIGEVCELVKVQPHVLRYWETEFPMLAPQKNRAGQRIYRRKDVEMVLRIRNLLYEEKFTIAGAKKKLMEEMRKRVGRPRQLEADEEVDSTAAAPAQDLGPQIRRALKTIKRDLEELLTMLTSDVSIKP